MRRASLYSNSPRSRAASFARNSQSPENPVEAPAKRRWRDLYSAYERQLLFGAMVLLLLLSAHQQFSRARCAAVSQQTIDAAVQRIARRAVAAVARRRKSSTRCQGAIVLVRTGADALEHDEYLQRAAAAAW